MCRDNLGFRSLLLCAALAAAATTAVVIAGPPDFRPLKLMSEGVQPVPAAAPAVNPEANNAYYYSNGRKIFLNDTGMAVAKLKQDIMPNAANLPFRAAALTVNSPLGDLVPTLERAGMMVVNTQGPTSMNLHSAPAEHPAHIEHIMPIVAPVDGPAAQGVNASDQMIMTPRIAARFERGVTDAEVQEYVQSVGLKVASKQEVPGGYILELAEGRPTYSRVLQGANLLYEKGQADKKVLYSHPDFVPTKKRLQPPADSLFGMQWHLDNTGQEGGKALADVRALDAWKITMGNPEIIIAIVDDSVEGNHPDLTANFKKGRYYNGLTGVTSDDPSPRDGTQRHGTSCAGVAVGAANTIGGRGLAPKCGLIGVNFWDASVAQTAEAFYFCNNNGAAVISCSWSWGSAFDSVSEAIKDLYVTGRGGKGSVILFAAGNESGSISFQQRFGTLKEVICVGATNWRDDHAPYSNHGAELCVVAPSSDRYWIRPESLGVLTTDNTESSVPSSEGFSGYANGDFTAHKGAGAFGGTSSATPLVAGLCGLILSANPNLTAKQVREILETTAEKIPGELRPAQYSSSGHDLYYGYGRVNAKRALDKVLPPMTTPGTVIELPVIVASATQGEIATAGEKDLYQFKALQAAGFTIETEGNIDTFVSLFGPNSPTTLIGNDDDSGSNRNSRLVVQLAPGAYFVQVRHFSPAGIGKYGVKVSR